MSIANERCCYLSQICTIALFFFFPELFSHSDVFSGLSIWFKVSFLKIFIGATIRRILVRNGRISDIKLIGWRQRFLGSYLNLWEEVEKKYIVCFVFLHFTCT